MYEQPAYGLQTVAGEDMVLQSVNVEVAFNNLLCETSMTQVYQNQGEKPIEAVYTFPLASHAVLLGLKVTIGDRNLQGVVVEKASAEEQYEEAITDGDTAIMLEQLQPGLYTMNVGNLLAGEELSITIIYTELYSWQGDTLRFYLPTTIALRYGNMEIAGLQPHQTPEYDLLAGNRFQLKINITGILSDADINSPSHPITLAKSMEKTIVTLAAGETSMDRDFILNIRSNQVKKDVALVDIDLDGKFVALASFVPQLPAPDKTPPKSIKIVVDCSGSMAGDSITQARQAISDIFNQLRPEDHFNLIAFGSTIKTFFDRQVQANKKNITKLNRQLRSLDADMGGTEIQQALQAAIQLPGPAIPQDILLITDGEVWESDEIINTAKKSGHRIFTVGVGSSVSESFVRQLAKETGGACELVAPQEKMAEKIVRHFKRIYLPQAENVVVHWPVEPVRIVPGDIGPVYDGDTLHIFACFDEKPCGPIILDMTLADGQTVSQTAIPGDQKNTMSDNNLPGALARIAINKALDDESEKNATDLAVKYQLISPNTNYLIIETRNEKEKGQELPTLRKVPQMLAAGWGGTGTVLHERIADYCRPQFSREKPEAQISFQRQPSPEQKNKNRQKTSPDSFVSSCNLRHRNWFRSVLQIVNFADLLDCNLPDRILEVIETIAEQYDPKVPGELIVLVFLYTLEQSAIGKGFNRNTRRAIKKTWKIMRPDKQLINLMTEAFADITKDDWGANYPLRNENNQESNRSHG